MGLLFKIILICFVIGMAFVMWCLCAASSEFERYCEQQREIEKQSKSDSGIFK